MRRAAPIRARLLGRGAVAERARLGRARAAVRVAMRLGLGDEVMLEVAHEVARDGLSGVM